MEKASVLSNNEFFWFVFCLFGPECAVKRCCVLLGHVASAAELLWRISCGTVEGRGNRAALTRWRAHPNTCLHTNTGMHTHRSCDDVQTRSARNKKKLEKEITGMHREADIFSDWCPVIFQTWQLRSAHLSVCARVCVFVHLSATCAFVNTVSVFFFNIWVVHGGSDSYTLAGW